jgi:hypothetical protein
MQRSADIEHNRRGWLSPEQAKVIISMDYATMMGTMFFLFAPVVAAFAVVQWAHDRGGAGAYALAAVAGIAAIAFGIGGMLVFRGRMARRAQHVPVHAMDGEVSWNGQKWVAHGRAPHGLIDLVTFPLPPGPFRFYVYQGRIVGAESPLGPGSFSLQQILGPSSIATMRSFVSSMTALPIGDRQALVAALAQSLGFTPEELEANRRGMLTPRQGYGAVTTLEGEAHFKWRLVSKFEPAHTFIVIGASEVRIPFHFSAVFVPGLRYRLYCRAADGALVSLEPL